MSTPTSTTEPVAGPAMDLSTLKPGPCDNFTVPGWPNVAKLMADHQIIQSFGAFSDLNIKSLLYYQAELDHLRSELHKVEWEDHRRNEVEGINPHNFAKNLDHLLLSWDHRDPSVRKQWGLILKLRRLLKEYSEIDLPS
jgi:hypothetical protein